MPPTAFGTSPSPARPFQSSPMSCIPCAACAFSTACLRFTLTYFEREEKRGTLLSYNTRTRNISFSSNARRRLPPLVCTHPHSLRPHPSSTRYTVGTVVQISPKANTRLSGLYTSGGMFCTQCEAEGFRRITFAQDRPDVMSTFSVIDYLFLLVFSCSSSMPPCLHPSSFPHSS